MDDVEIVKRVGRFESFDGTPVYYEVRGEGPAIIMAYGIGCLINHWQHQIDFFSRNYQTIVFDYRGHNHTPTPASRENLTIDALARDMLGLLNKLNIGSASVWGHSFGAQVVLRAYDLNPQVFANLVFVNGFASNPITNMFGIDVVEKFFKYFKKGHELLPDTLEAMWKYFVTNPLSVQLAAIAGGFNLNLAHVKDIEIYAKGLSALNLDVFISFFDQMMSYDARNVLPKISVPALVISGKQDSVTPQSYQEFIQSQIKSSQFLSVPYGSHCTQLDLPDFVNARIAKFLREHDFTPGESANQIG